jgi:PAS domain-containing protein
MPIERFVLSANVERYRDLLANTTDTALSLRLSRMIAAAERELALLDAARRGVLPPAEGVSAASEVEREDLLAWFRTTYGDDERIAALIDPAPGLAIVEINRAYELGSGLRREDVIGKLQFELYPDNPNDPEADGVFNLYTSLRTVAETGQPHAMALQRYDTRDAEGNWSAPRFWRPVNTPVHDSRGRTVFLLHLVEAAEAPETPVSSMTPETA